MFRLNRLVAFAVLSLVGVGLLYGQPTTAAAADTAKPAAQPSAAVYTAKPAAQASDASKAESLYQTVWKTTRDNFLWQDKLADWSNWEHRYDRKLKTTVDAEAAIQELLASLKDKYTKYIDASQTAKNETAADARNVVDARMLPNKVGYIHIKTFGSTHTAVEMADALLQLDDATSLIIDLRDNPGGFVQEAFKVFAMLADKGTFTKMSGTSQGKASTEELVLTAQGLSSVENGSTTTSDRSDNYAGKKPMVVLINGNTASAAEMLAGALRDNGRAKLIGNTTYGKGICQMTINLTGKASLQITFARYSLPNGECLDKKGLRPDVTMQQTASSDKQLDEATAQLEKTSSAQAMAKNSDSGK